MKQLISILIFQFSVFNAFAQWTNLGLNEFKVNDLTIYSDTIYASTENGIYKKNIFSTDTVWLSCGKQGYYVVQTLVENYQTFISLIQLGSTNTTQIYKSNDAGNTFVLMNTDTSNFNSYQFLDHIAHPTNNYDTLYFLNHQLKTNDGGITWESIYNTKQTDRFIMVNPTNHSQLLIGGETGFFSAYLQYSNDYGKTWTIPAMNSFFAGDNAIHDLAIDDSIWYAAGEGVIAKSTDEGENWLQVLNLWADNSPFSLYYTDIEFSPVNKNILYVTGLKSSGSNKVPLLYSENQGATWDTISCSSITSNQRIRCITIKNTDNTDNVFLGGNGVYLYKKLVNNLLQLNSNLDLIIYPNPANNLLYIKTDKTISNIKIYNALGYEVLVEQNKENIINLYALSTGLYIMTLTIENVEVTRKFIKE
ncbi:MAG: T9SS type A sorting domain-containing protein [Cytophagales bacterium]|nr:T9SS type A sorting domain-containing protein [Cytophagales bacterium]